MAKRPSVFELEQVAAELREQGVSESSIGPTVSFMRLAIPLVIQHVGEEGIVDIVIKAKKDWGLDEDASHWVKVMSPHVANWAKNNVERYKADRFGPSAIS